MSHDTEMIIGLIALVSLILLVLWIVLMVTVSRCLNKLDETRHYICYDIRDMQNKFLDYANMKADALEKDVRYTINNEGSKVMIALSKKDKKQKKKKKKVKKDEAQSNS